MLDLTNEPDTLTMHNYIFSAVIYKLTYNKQWNLQLVITCGNCLHFIQDFTALQLSMESPIFLQCKYSCHPLMKIMAAFECKDPIVNKDCQLVNLTIPPFLQKQKSIPVNLLYKKTKSANGDMCK